MLESEINVMVKVGHAGRILPIIDEMFKLSGASNEGSRSLLRGSKNTFESAPSPVSSPARGEEKKETSQLATRNRLIDLIAVGTGPGSFTGIRIGIVTAKGLAFGYGCKLAGINTLDALAYGALPSPYPVMPIMDARKCEIFCALYCPDGNVLTPYMNIKPKEVRDIIKEPTLFIGDGLDLYRDTLAQELGDLFIEGPKNLWFPRASVIGLMASSLPEDKLSSDVNPFYVRLSDATLAIQK